MKVENESGISPSTFKAVWVCGHLNPDTDSIVAAHVYSELLNTLHPVTVQIPQPFSELNTEREGAQQGFQRSYLPVRLGPASQQTSWLFNEAQAPLPPLKEDFKWRVRDICSVPPVTVDLQSTLGDVIRLITSRQVSVAPVVDSENRIQGILSDRLPMGHYFYHFNMENFLGALFQMEDLIRGLDLQTLCPLIHPPEGKLCLEVGKIEPGDVFLCGNDLEALKTAVEAKAAAVITSQANLHPDWVRQFENSSSCKNTGVFQFEGSLLALTSQLSMAIPVRNLMASEFETLHPDWTIDEARAVMTRVPYACPVVDDQNKIVGAMSHGDILQAEPRKIILVDHFERVQAGDGVEEAEVLEIVDHHRVGHLETLMPVRVDCRPLGSSSTIIALKFEELSIIPSRSQAILLLGAIIADTLLLTSPTTTDTDKRVAEKLANIADLDLRSFGLKTLEQNDELHTLPIVTLLNKDLKSFTVNSQNFGVAQLETVDLNRALQHPDLLENFLSEMRQKREQKEWFFIGMLITDVLTGHSLWLVAAEANSPYLVKALNAWSDELMEDINHPNGRLWKNCVSRKKQVIPALLKTFRQI